MCKVYHGHENRGNFQQAAAWRHAAGQMHGQDSGHAQYQHYMVQQAQQAGQLGPMGNCLGAGGNPFRGNPPRNSAASVMQQYSLVNGQLHLGGQPYL